MMTTVTNTEFRQMQKFMNDSCFTHTDDWLLACMNWIKEDKRSISFDVWKRELTDQWRDANLHEMESSCLPPVLSSQKLVKLPGKYGLQVNSMRDIGESCYSQWTKLKKLENENTSVAATDSNEYTSTWQPTPKRCLYLNMTDGTQIIFGLEMQPISGLNLNMKPGFKIIIQGPVACRRGVIQLRQNNIRIVGGVVEDLLESNTMEQILVNTLNLTPVTGSSSRIQSSTSQISTNSIRSSSIVMKNSEVEVIGDFPETEDQFPDIGDDDNLFMQIDEDALIRSASSITPATVPISVNSRSQKSYPIAVLESPFVYLAQVKPIIKELAKRRKMVLVKACISTIVSNIQVENGGWTLCVSINDGTDYLNCKISANILDGIIGFTPAEMKKLKAAKTKDGKQQIAEGMSKLAKVLVHLNGIFAIETGVEPLITEVIDLKLHHSAALKSRLFKIGL